MFPTKNNFLTTQNEVEENYDSDTSEETNLENNEIDNDNTDSDENYNTDGSEGLDEEVTEIQKLKENENQETCDEEEEDLLDDNEDDDNLSDDSEDFETPELTQLPNDENSQEKLEEKLNKVDYKEIIKKYLSKYGFTEAIKNKVWNAVEKIEKKQTENESKSDNEDTDENNETSESDDESEEYFSEETDIAKIPNDTNCPQTKVMENVEIVSKEIDGDENTISNSSGVDSEINKTSTGDSDDKADLEESENDDYEEILKKYITKYNLKLEDYDSEEDEETQVEYVKIDNTAQIFEENTDENQLELTNKNSFTIYNITELDENYYSDENPEEEDKEKTTEAVVEKQIEEDISDTNFTEANETDDSNTEQLSDNTQEITKCDRVTESATNLNDEIIKPENETPIEPTLREENKSRVTRREISIRKVSKLTQNEKYNITGLRMEGKLSSDVNTINKTNDECIDTETIQLQNSDDETNTEFNSCSSTVIPCTSRKIMPKRTLSNNQSEVKKSLSSFTSIALTENENIKHWLIKKAEIEKKKQHAMQLEQEAKETEKKQNMEREKRNFEFWLNRKKVQQEKQKVATEKKETMKKKKEAEKQKKELENQVKYKMWLKKKEEEERQKKEIEKKKQQQAKEEKEKKELANQVAFEAWLQSSKNKQKPVLPSRGLASFKSANSISYINPKPWVPNIDPPSPH